ncbi:MAG: PTS sugar transporter subunit IIA [Novosphingobium sp.]
MSGLFTLLPEAVTTASADSKDIILGQLASLFAEVYDLGRDKILERMIEREELGSTGFGRRIAIPHARLPGLGRPVAAFIRLESPVEFDSADGMPVDLVFGLLSPEGAARWKGSMPRPLSITSSARRWKFSAKGFLASRS